MVGYAVLKDINELYYPVATGLCKMYGFFEDHILIFDQITLEFSYKLLKLGRFLRDLLSTF